MSIRPATAALARPGRRRVPQGRGLVYIVLLYPVAWVLGVGYFIWPILALPLLFSLLRQRRSVFPRGFGLWLLFLGWMLVSAVELDTKLRYALFAWRAATYLAATVLFVFVYNLPRRPAVERRVMLALVLFWAEVVLGGIAGVLFPRFAFHAPFESFAPKALLQDPTGYAYIHPALADLKSRALGFVVGRPKTFFAYTNQWGACIGVLTPFAVAFISRTRRGVARTVVLGLLVASLFPIVISVNRGLWIALAVAFLYAAFRVPANRTRVLSIAAVGAAVAAVLVLATPLHSLVRARVHGSATNSNATRASLYHQAIQSVEQSPLVGYGSPRPANTAVGTAYQNAHTGTQGQFFLVLFSHGIPGAVLYFGWFVLVLVRTRRKPSPLAFAAHVAVLVSLVESPFYDFIPTTLCVVAIAAAVALRRAPVAEEARAPRLQPTPAVPALPVVHARAARTVG